MDAFDPIAVVVLKMVRKSKTLDVLKCGYLSSRQRSTCRRDGSDRYNRTDHQEHDGVQRGGKQRGHVHAGTEERDFLRCNGSPGSQLIPWHCYMGFFIGISASVYPLAANITAGDIITHNYLAWIAVGSMLFLTFTGTDRFIPLFKHPFRTRCLSEESGGPIRKVNNNICIRLHLIFA